MQAFYWRKNINNRRIDMRTALSVLIIATLAASNYQIQAKESRTSLDTATQKSSPDLTSRLLQLIKKCQNFNQKISPRTYDTRNTPDSSEIVTKKPSLSIVSTKKLAAKPTKSRPRKTRKPNTTPPVISEKNKSSWSFLDFFTRFRGPAPFSRR